MTQIKRSCKNCIDGNNTLILCDPLRSRPVRKPEVCEEFREKPKLNVDNFENMLDVMRNIEKEWRY
jgi:hypothetical protein